MIKMPSEDEANSYRLDIAAKYTTLDEVYCVADGLKLHLE